MKQENNASSRSSRPSTASTHIQAEAERAALEAHAAVLEEKHALEEQMEEQRRKKERLELHTEMTASAAKLAVLTAASPKAPSNVPSNGMESYFEGGGKVKETSTAYKPDGKGAILKATATTLNPQAKEYQPTLVSSQQQPFMQQQRQHAYWNVTQIKGHNFQLNETREHGQTLR